ncbi:MAG: hisA/hisF family protein [Planctomycetes bacterium]|nr:hisA/hisF family protein [Planctomycetota bacterium]
MGRSSMITFLAKTSSEIMHRPAEPRPRPEIYPVIDLKGGVVVRGAGGERALYRPVESRIAPSAEPLAVARAFRERLGLSRLYVADLDALGGAPPDARSLGALAADGFGILVDAGVRSAAEARALLELGASEVVAPLESLPGPDALADVVEALGPERAVFSLDLKAGRLLGDPRGWPQSGAAEVAGEAWRRGARRILVLDLAAVGSRGGPAHLGLLRSLAAELGSVELLAGGGVRSRADLEALAGAGARGILVATALHEEAVTRRDIDELAGHDR